MSFTSSTCKRYLASWIITQVRRCSPTFNFTITKQGWFNVKGVLNFSSKQSILKNEFHWPVRKVHNYIILKSPNSRPRIRLLHWFPAQASAQSSCPENPDERTSDESLIILSIISKNFTDIWILFKSILDKPSTSDYTSSQILWISDTSGTRFQKHRIFAWGGNMAAWIINGGTEQSTCG